MSDERQERRKRREERRERREERGCVVRTLRITAIPMRCRPNFGLTQVEPELGHYLA